jgi:hypothetical protein
MATEIIPAPNVVRFPYRPHVRSPGLADALVYVSGVRAVLEPLDQADAITRFNDAQAGETIRSAISALSKALTRIQCEPAPGPQGVRT